MSERALVGGQIVSWSDEPTLQGQLLLFVRKPSDKLYSMTLAIADARANTFTLSAVQAFFTAPPLRPVRRQPGECVLVGTDFKYARLTLFLFFPCSFLHLSDLNQVLVLGWAASNSTNLSVLAVNLTAEPLTATVIGALNSTPQAHPPPSFARKDASVFFLSRNGSRFQMAKYSPDGAFLASVYQMSAFSRGFGPVRFGAHSIAWVMQDDLEMCTFLAGEFRSARMALISSCRRACSQHYDRKHC